MGELAKLFQVLNRDTEGVEQPSIRNKMYLDLCFRVFYSSDTDNKFSARQDLNSLLSSTGMNMDEGGLQKKVATEQRFIRWTLQRNPVGLGLSHAAGMTN